MNIVPYIRQRYIPRLLRRLTEEYNAYLSVLKVCLPVITDKRVYVSCSV
jgi:hypothetical protein